MLRGSDAMDRRLLLTAATAAIGGFGLMKLFKGSDAKAASDTKFEIEKTDDEWPASSASSVQAILA